MMPRNATLILFIGILIFLLSSCKERNEIFPPVTWTDYFFEKENVPARPVSAILILDQHTEWYGSLNNQGLLYNNGYEWKAFQMATSSIPFDSVTCILRDGNGLVWVSWKSGLACFDGSNWKTIDELKGKRVTSLAVQGVGILWAGIDGDEQTGGLAKLSNGNWSFIKQGNSGMQSSHVTALAIDHDQNLWVGTADKGLIRFDGNYWSQYNLNTLYTVAGRINSIAVDNEGMVWVGTQNSQLVKFTGSQIIYMSTGTGKPITSLVAEAGGKLWIGTAGAGVITLQNGLWSGYTSVNMHLPSDSVLTMALHPDGKVLASFPDGHILYFK
jgi:ligand-binding sensor domain-containing protein